MGVIFLIYVFHLVSVVNFSFIFRCPFQFQFYVSFFTVYTFFSFVISSFRCFFLSCHYYTNEYAQRCTFTLRGGHLFLPATVNPTIYCGGHFLFTAAGTFSRHGKSIYRGGHLNMSATVNTLFTVADIVRCPPR